MYFSARTVKAALQNYHSISIGNVSHSWANKLCERVMQHFRREQAISVTFLTFGVVLVTHHDAELVHDELSSCPPASGTSSSKKLL